MEAPCDELEAYTRTGSRPHRWDKFTRRKRLYRALREKLLQNQHYLCAYCERELSGSASQIEHVIPRSDPRAGRQNEFAIGNLVACCLGGTEDHHPSSSDLKRQVSCGQSKGSRLLPVDPRTLPDQPSLLSVSRDGVISPDINGCSVMNIRLEAISATIEVLGLNSRRLQRLRRRHWDMLRRESRSFINDHHTVEAIVVQRLLPNKGGKLSEFFTSTRSFFGVEAEMVLAVPPRSWV